MFGIVLMAIVGLAIAYYLKKARNSACMRWKPREYVLFGRSPSTFVDKVLSFRRPEPLDSAHDSVDRLLGDVFRRKPENITVTGGDQSCG